MKTEQQTDRILLGHITAISGLKGWVKVHSDTDPRENIVSYTRWWLERSGQWQQVKVLEGRPQGKTIVAKIGGVDNPEQASAYIGCRIAVERDELPALPAGEFYWTDLVGKQVKTRDGVFVGQVVRMFETGANDVMVVSDQREQQERGNTDGAGAAVGNEILVPWLVPDVITDIDLDSGVISIDWDPDF